ncbi:hypothetical protein AB1N83_013362 [Pleurotus pulmonarius]
MTLFDAPKTQLPHMKQGISTTLSSFKDQGKGSKHAAHVVYISRSPGLGDREQTEDGTLSKLEALRLSNLRRVCKYSSVPKLKRVDARA